jgi:hypothetical protein
VDHHPAKLAARDAGQNDMAITGMGIFAFLREIKASISSTFPWLIC